jgi:hypothetical protein
MLHRRGVDPFGLIFVDEREDNLGLAGLDDKVAPAADQGRGPVFVRDRDRDRDPRDVLDEADVEKIVGLFLGNLPFDRKEAKVERFRASAARQPSRSSGR